MADWIDYRNEGATRNMPLSDELVAALEQFIPDMGLRMAVYSGGQPARGSGLPRTGSTRHDLGNAADADFYHPELGRLDARIPEHRTILADIVRRGREAGLTGFGMGMDEGDYMGPHRMHLGYGAEAVWGDDGRGENAPDWLRDAYYGVGPTRERASAGLPLARDPLPQGPGLDSRERRVPGFVQRGNDWLEDTFGITPPEPGDNRGQALMAMGLRLMNEGF